MTTHRHALTLKVPLPGGQDRLRQMILYVARRNETARRFGRVKLNKILWRSDFRSYASRGVPVTGREYQRLQYGPAPREMYVVYREMQRDGLIDEDAVAFGDGIVEFRPIAKVNANLDRFSSDDIGFVDDAIAYYWQMTGAETSDDSHGAAWSSRFNGDPMPYESAFLSDVRVGPEQRERLKRLIATRGIQSE